MNVRGAQGLTRTWQSELEISRDGATASIRYEAPASVPNILTLLPTIGTTHPDYRGITLKRIQLARTEAGKWSAMCHYDGEAGGSPSGPAYEVNGTPALREVPIETHPKFTEWAGTYKAPKEGLFDDAGRFIGWQPSSKFYGVTSYLSPSLEVSVTVLEPRVPDVTAIGKIVSGGKGLPRIGGKRNWMLVAMPYRTSGDGVMVTYTYLLSGKNGWDRRIYS